ncbi:bifunctional adenosylcobinamide kinase/adenosylcobinamide-phosphate guanylyltransferase [Nocardioides pantholopis]|uniref:bifunctional adenosylcobinamide kinase/adenosylcobinamide-phosphate guanylyltransferase n=1 Tax=Nocardioides pantholopis TaxID=2483798 RepID=UPI0019D08EDB|nr:bifunctional adenosylcobinamide kinase/adenosylcobinamide-phosphate guanylyltransferase [Nocardioides pantholopis]
METATRSYLVTGGVRSGKSTHAERLLRDHPAVTYVAPGPVPDPAADPDWAARIAHHRARRPAGWRTVETGDVAGAVAAADGAVLVDCLGTWLTAQIDAANAWDAAADEIHALVLGHLDALIPALAAAAGPTVLVTNEVGLGVVPEHRSGRLFRDLLGIVNQRVAAGCDEVHLVVAGRVLVL